MTQSRKRYDRQFKVAAAKVVLEGETTVVDLSRELGIKDAALRRWAKEHEEMGEGAFPGSGSPKTSKDHGILRPEKQVEELERENTPPKNLRAFLSQDRARGIASPRSTEVILAPSRRPASL